MPSLKQLEAQGRALLAEQKNLVDNDRRPWSLKQAEFDNRARDLDAIHAQASSLKAVDGWTLDALGDGGASRGGGRASSLAGSIAAKGYQPIGTPQLDLDNDQATELYEAALSHKSLSVTTKATTSSSIAPATITDYRLPPVTARREPTRVLSLIPTFATEHPTVTWFSTTGTTAADAVAEGGTKPTSTLSYTGVTTNATKIAHVAEVTDETLADFGGFMSVLTADMVAGLIKTENNEMLNATVAGAHMFPGLLNTSGILTRATAADTNLDAISKAFDDLRNGSAFAQPDGVIMHPSTWGNTRRYKDSQGRYLLAPDPTKDGDMTLWGVPVILTTQIAAGTALIGNFAESCIAYVRDGIRVETANQGSTQFTANTTLVRCEERILLTVPRPTGVLKLTGLA